MKNESFEKELTRKELMQVFVEEHLMNLKEKRPITKGKIATVLHGQYAHQGMMVIETREDGIIHVLPSPESDEPIEFKETEIYDFEDYHEAFRKGLEKYPFTPKELGVDLPDAMNN